MVRLVPGELVGEHPDTDCEGAVPGKGGGDDLRLALSREEEVLVGGDHSHGEAHGGEHEEEHHQAVTSSKC